MQNLQRLIIGHTIRVYTDGIVVTTEFFDDIEAGDMFIVENIVYVAEENQDFVDIPKYELETYFDVEVKLRAVLKLSNLSIREIRTLINLKHGGKKVHDGLTEKGLITNELHSNIKLSQLGRKVRQYLATK